MLSAPAAASGRPAGADRAPSPTAPGGSPSPVCRIHGPPLTQLPLTATLRLHLGPRSPPPPGHPVSSLSRPLARWPLFTPASSGPGPQRLPSRPCGLPAPSHAALGGGRCLQNLATLTLLGPLPRQTDRWTAFPGSPLIPTATFTLCHTFPPACPHPALREWHFHRRNRSQVWSPRLRSRHCPSPSLPSPKGSPLRRAPSAPPVHARTLWSPPPRKAARDPPAPSSCCLLRGLSPRAQCQPSTRLFACFLTQSSPHSPMVALKSLEPRSLTPSH